MVYGRDPRVDGHQEEEHNFGVTQVTRAIHEGTVSPYTHYSMLAAIEARYRLPALGGAQTANVLPL